MEFRTVCTYFLEGRCRFGHNCRNKHVYSKNSGGNNDSTNILWEIVNEVIATEKGGQWPLTSFAPIVQHPGLPGWEDISPEEVRWTLYEAQKNGTVNQALNQINQWYQNAEKQRNLLKQKAPEVVNAISEIIKGNQSNQLHTSKNTFPSSIHDTKSSFRFDTAVTNIFGKATTPAQSLGNSFGSSPAQSTPNDSSNIFIRPQQQQQPPGQNIFASGINSGQNIFSSSTGGIFSQGFSNSNTTNQNIFQTSLSTTIFQGPPAAFGGSSTIFSSGQRNVFQQSNQTTDFNAFPFKTENAGFGNENASVKEVDSSVYSKIEDLNDNEINSFTSTTFTFGNIPMKPPPQQYC